MPQTQVQLKTPRPSFSDVLDALRKQLVYIDPGDISLVYVDGYTVKVYTKSGVRIVLDGESLEIFYVESLADALRNIASIAFDRDE